MIAIVDYGIGNVGAIRNMLKRIGAQARLTADPAELRTADKLILPGIGAFDRGMSSLERTGLVPLLNELVLERGTPILGICLGMQLFARASEEGSRKGLGWIDARVVRFDAESAGHLKVPHMRWNSVAPAEGATLLVDDEPRWYYFVHSYHLVCADATDVAGTTKHGYDFASAVQRGRIFGVQFHPEKSLRHGMRLLRRFAELTPNA